MFGNTLRNEKPKHFFVFDSRLNQMPFGTGYLMVQCGFYFVAFILCVIIKIKVDKSIAMLVIIYSLFMPQMKFT